VREPAISVTRGWNAGLSRASRGPSRAAKTLTPEQFNDKEFNDACPIAQQAVMPWRD
jgi:hypothetical protein